MAGFAVKTAAFEGPLELLLDLIEKRKLLVNDVSLAAVTDDYIQYLEGSPEFPVGETAQFILVASTLLLIKSKSLLPSLELSETEQGDIADLEKRLRIYQRFRELGRGIEKQFGAAPLYAASGTATRETPVFAPSRDLSRESMIESIRRVLTSLPKQIFMPQAVVEKVISLEEMIDTLAARVSSALSLSFREFAGVGKAKKADVIIGFLAMLELVKRGSLHVIQQASFGDILIESERVETPRYGA